MVTLNDKNPFLIKILRGSISTIIAAIIVNVILIITVIILKTPLLTAMSRSVSVIIFVIGFIVACISGVLTFNKINTYLKRELGEQKKSL